MKGNHKWVAFPWQTQGGGILCVVRVGVPRKLELSYPKIVGHKGPVLDFEFSPFDEGKKVTLILISNVYFKIWL